MRSRLESVKGEEVSEGSRNLALNFLSSTAELMDMETRDASTSHARYTIEAAT